MANNQEITLQCEKCKKVFILGKDALVISAASALRGFQGVTFLGGGSSPTNSQETPDLVDSLGDRSWDSLEPNIKQMQEAEIRRITGSMPGKKQWWRCRKCSTVQAYT